MAHSLTETSTYDASIVVPDNSDARNAASVGVPFQALANRTKYLLEHGNIRAVATHLNTTDDPTANGATTISNVTWTDIVSCATPALSVKSGDVIAVVASVSAYRDNTAASASGFRVRVQGALLVDQTVIGAHARVNLPNDGTNTGQKHITLASLYTVSADDSSMVFRLQAIGGAASGSLIARANDMIFAIVMRPAAP